MKYKVVKSAISIDTWSVEAIDHEDEGLCYVTTFYGPDSHERALEYAFYKNVRTMVKGESHE